MAKTKAKTQTKQAAAAAAPTGEPSTARPSALFKKVVMRPGVAYGTRNGKLAPANMSEERLRRIAATAQEQLTAGHKIPGPARHYKKGKALVDLVGEKFVWDANLNQGYWKKFDFVDDASQYDPSFDPGPAWVGEFEAPGDAQDLSTPAGKVGTTLQEVSPLILPSYTDGTGREWKDFVGHVALPIHAMETNQENFVLAMSAEAPEDDSEYEVVFSDIGASDNTVTGAGTEQPQVDDPELIEVIESLRQPPHNLDLPEETTRDTFIQVLRIAVRQSVASARQVDTMNSPPAGASQRPSPIAMSAEDMENTVATALLKRTVRETKANLTTRLNRLRSNGVVQKEENYNAMKADIDGISFSAEDIDENGDFPTPYIEREIARFESEGRPLTGNLLDGNDAQSFSAPTDAEALDPPAAGMPDISADDLNAVLDRAVPSR